MFEQPADQTEDRVGSGVRLPGQGLPVTPPGLQRLVRLDVLRNVSPGLAAGIAVTATDGDAGDGLLAAIVILFSTALLLRDTLPLHLMQASRVFIAILAPLLGSGTIALAALLGSGVQPSFGQDFLVPVSVAALTGMLTNLLYLGVMARRPVRVATIGSPVFAAGLERELNETRMSAVKMVGHLNIRPPGGPQVEGNVGSILAEETERHAIDVLVFGESQGRGDDGDSLLFQQAAESCLDLRVRLIAGSQFYEQVFGHVPLGSIDSAWYLYIVHPDFRPPAGFLNRLMTLMLSVPIALLVSPFILLGALAVKLEDRGPVFFRQVRVGERGRHFEILKLRTMRVDAERDGIQFSSSGDVRVTRVGKVLRRTHIDELPQIFNVVRGEMSLVGPRPEQPEIVAEMEQFFAHYSRRHLLRPGVTGWAQVRCGYAGSTLGTAWKLCHDLYYLKHRSLFGDLLIMVQTLVIAVKDAHRPLRVPESQFIYGRQLGIDTEVDEDGGRPEIEEILPADLNAPKRKKVAA